MDWIYLDNNATTQPAPAVVAVMDRVNRDLWANPSSVHRFGQQVRHEIEQARVAVANLIGTRPRDLVFTSGGTESNNLALRGMLDRGVGQSVLVTTAVEHAAVREPAAQLEKRGASGGGGVRVVMLPIDGDGVVRVADVASALDEWPDDARVLLSIQWANNETGAIQPIEEIATLVNDRRSGGQGVYLHVDATQAVGKLPIDLAANPIDMMTLSAHKFHGPKGIGALYIRRGVRLQPQLHGGPQERDRRGGTEYAPGIIGMGLAAELAGAFLADSARLAELASWRDAFESQLLERLPGTVVNSAGARRLWNTSNLGFEHVEAEAVLIALSEQGVCASAGAACSSGSLEPSPVLLAMGVPESIAHGSVRFSLSRDTMRDELDRAIESVVQVVTRLRQTLPMG